MKTQANKIFEICWETCNKVGGINTVIKTKANHMVDIYGEDYILVGPYFPEKAKGEFEETIPPPALKEVFEKLSERGIRVHFGKWLIPGEPQTLLIDYKAGNKDVNELKEFLWREYEIDSLSADSSFDDPVNWGFWVSELLKGFVQSSSSVNVVAHFHEWLAGSSLVFLDKELPIKTVFTTHATFLGRSLAGHDFPLYEKLDSIEPDKEAKRLQVQAKYGTEKAAAQKTDVLTTVSETTAMEVEKLLGREPDLLLPNGLDLSRLPTFEEAALKHRTQRDRMREFLLYYFFPYYDFDVRNSLFYFISGRYEMRNKGIDVFIRALSELNDRLKGNQEARTIISFLWIPAETRSIKPEIIEQRELFNDLSQTLKDAEITTESNLLYSILADKEISKERLFNKPVLRELKKVRSKLLRASGSPPICTHDLEYQNDPIIESLREHGLTNKEKDKVKVIFYPIYLTGSDGLLNLNYEECVQGSHLGVFSSYYEPWGYTPLETASLGVPSITSDLAGFGRFIQGKAAQKEYRGIFINKRFQKGDEETVEDLADRMEQYASYSRRERVETKIAAQDLSQEADWGKLIENYIQAHNKAVEEG